MRIGQGFDVHALVEGRKLLIGGVDVPYERGLAGHSDADVLTHAIIDALLGAAGLGDIGQHFPDTDDRWKDADSIGLTAIAPAVARPPGKSPSRIDRARSKGERSAPSRPKSARQAQGFTVVSIYGSRLSVTNLSIRAPGAKSSRKSATLTSIAEASSNG